jgi:hypothetical protein
VLDGSPAITRLDVEMQGTAGCLCQGGHQDTLDAASATSLYYVDVTVRGGSGCHKGRLGADSALLLSGKAGLRYRERPQS